VAPHLDVSTRIQLLAPDLAVAEFAQASEELVERDEPVPEFAVLPIDELGVDPTGSCNLAEVFPREFVLKCETEGPRVSSLRFECRLLPSTLGEDRRCDRTCDRSCAGNRVVQK
jgi:hypothetical protein